MNSFMFDLDVPQEPQEPTPIQRAAQAAAEREKKARERTLQMAAQRPSTEAANALGLAQTTGLSPEVVAQDPKVVEQQLAEKALRMAATRKKNPVLAQMLEREWFASAAKADLDNLASSEGLFGWIGDQASWVGRQVLAGHLQNEQGYLGLMEALAHGGNGPPELKARLEEIDKALGVDGHGFIGGTLSVLGQVAETVPPALAVGAGTSALTTPLGGVIAGGSTAFALNSGLEFGRQYHAMRARGVPHDEALVWSGAGGVGVGALDTLGQLVGAKVFGKAAGKVFGKASKVATDITVSRARLEFVKDYLKVLGSEMGTETTQEGVAWAAEQAALADAGFRGDDWSTAASRMGDAFAQTAMSMALLAGIGPAANYIANQRLVRYVDNREQFYTRLGKLADENEMAGAAPGAHEEFIARTAGASGADTFYVRGTAAADVLRQADESAQAAGDGSASAAFEAKLPGITERIATAARDGTDVEIPVAKLVRSQLYEAFKPHMRLDPAEPSFAEVEEAKETQPELFKSLQKEIDDRLAFDEAADKIEKRVVEEINAARGVSTEPNAITGEQAKITATLVRRLYEQLAIRQGKNPSELKPLRFAPGDTAARGAGTLGQPDRGYYDPKTNTIHLNQRATASTLMHELAHASWEMMLAIAEPDGVLTEDLGSMFQWLGLTREQWDALDFKGREKHHEKIAYSFEKFVHEGKAPVVELQGVFERLAALIRKVYTDIATTLNAQYRKLFGEDLPALTDDVRRVFGNLFAGEAAILKAEAVRGRVAAFTDRSAFPGNDQEWAEYQALVEARREGGIAKLNARLLKDMAWLGRSRDRVSNEVAKEARELRKAAGEEAADEVAQRGVYMLRTWLKTARNEGEQVHRLRVDEIKDIFGPEAHDVLEALKGMVSENGWPSEFLAEQFGFDTAEAMIRALVDEPTLADAIEVRTDEIMLRDHGSLRSAEEQAMAIEEALNSEAASRLANYALRVAERNRDGVEEFKSALGHDRLTAAAIKEVARQKLNATAVRNVKARSFSLAATRAERDANTAFKGKKASKTRSGVERAAQAPDPEAGIDLLRQAALNQEMARQAVKAEREVTRLVERAKRFFSSDKKVLKNRNLDWVNVGRAILAGYGIGNRQVLPMEYLASLEQYDPVLNAQLAEHVVLATGGIQQDYRNLTLEKFRDLTARLDDLWDRAERERQVLADGKLVAKEDALGDLTRQLVATLGEPNPVAPLNSADRKASKFQISLAKLSKMEHVLRFLDGGRTDGPFQRYVWRPLSQAQDRYHEDRAVLMRRVNGAIQKLHDDGLLSQTKFDARKTLGTVFDNTAHVLGLLYHIGNSSNLDNLLKGYGWSEKQWNAFLQDLHDSKRITRRHIDFLQSLGDINAELLVRAQKVNHEAYGTFMKEVEIKPLDTPWGKIKGWYAPSNPDPNNPVNNDIWSQVDTDSPILNGARNMAQTSPKVPAGWTKERKNAVRPRELDITRAAGHIDTVLRFIHMQIPLRDAWSLFQDPKLNSAISRLDPTMIPNVIKPALDDTALGRMSKPGLGGPLVDKWLRFFTRNTSRMFMLGSLRNWLQQYTGMANVLAYVDKPVAKGAVQQMTSMGLGRTQEFITGKSRAMRVRFDQHHANMLTEMKLWLDPTLLGKIDRGADKAAYYLIGAAQHQSDMVAWLAGYNDSLTKSPADEDAAIAAGDSLVRLSQGQRTPLDVATIERSTPEVAMVLQFAHYWINLFNSVRFANRSAAAKARALTWAFLVPTFAGAAIAAALSGGKEFEDTEGEDKGEFDAWRVLRWGLATPVRGGGSMFPFFGPTLAAVLSSDKRGGEVSSPFAAWAGVQATGRTVGDIVDNILYAAGNDEVEARVRQGRRGATTGRGIRDLGTTISFWTGVPVRLVTQALAHLEDRADKQAKTNLFSGLTGNAR